jgi:NADH dehydrogenase
MLNLQKEKKKRLVIVGAGFAGLELAKKLKNKPVDVIVVDRNNYFTFQPLLYQVAMGGLEANSVAFPYRQIFRKADNIQFRMADVELVDTTHRILHTDSGSLRYDYLVLASGSRPNFFGLNEDQLFPLKNLPNALAMRNWILSKLEEATKTPGPDKRTRLLNIVLVGGGPTGVELAGALGEMKKYILPKDYPDLDPSSMRILLIEGQDQLLPAMSKVSGQKAQQYLEGLGVEVYLGELVKDFHGEAIEVGGQTVPCSDMIWTAGVKGQAPLGFEEEQYKNGRIKVDKYSRVLGYRHIYAIGDLALMSSDEYSKGHPMLAPVAIQQGKHLAKNFSRIFNGKELLPFEYQDKGTMATIGRNKAVVEMGKIKFQGFLAWLAWMGLHLFTLVGFRNRLIVLINWVYNYFRYDKALRLIIRRTEKKSEEVSHVVDNQ